MRRIAGVDLEELAELREKAARVCDETKSLIEESGRLREWLDEFRRRAMPLIEATLPAITVSNSLPPRPGA